MAINSMLGNIQEKETLYLGRLLQRVILYGLKSTYRIVCVSDNTRRELKALVGDKKHKITRAFNPLNNKFAPVRKESSKKIISNIEKCIGEKLNTGFILHVGGNQWYKNREGVCRIFAEIDRIRSEKGYEKISLILAGKQPTDELLRFVEGKKQLRIFFVTNPTDKEIITLYSEASVLLYPSLHEGFGWPIIEAMACGCPVVTTKKQPMTEAGGEAASYINPLNISEAALITNDILELSEIERIKKINYGYENIKRFNKNEMVNMYKQAYQDALNNHLSKKRVRRGENYGKRD